MKSVVLVFGVAACGGGSSAGGTTISEAQLKALCGIRCEHDVECGEVTTVAECSEDCVAMFSGWARGVALETLLECAASLSCGVDKTVCYEQVRPIPIHEEWEERCRTDLCIPQESRDSACEVDLADPEAGSIAMSFIAAPIVREILTCFDHETECVDRTENCMRTILFGEHGIPTFFIPFF